MTIVLRACWTAILGGRCGRAPRRTRAVSYGRERAQAQSRALGDRAARRGWLFRRGRAKAELPPLPREPHGQTTLIESWPRTLRQRLRAYLRWLGFAMIYGSFAALWVFYGGSCSSGSEEDDVGWEGLLVFVLCVAGFVVAWRSEPLHGAIHEGEVHRGRRLVRSDGRRRRRRRQWGQWRRRRLTAQHCDEAFRRGDARRSGRALRGRGVRR